MFLFGKVVKDKHKLLLTQMEQEEGGEVLWMLPQEALGKIKQSYEKLIPSKYSTIYSSKFVEKRDQIILEEYIKTITNKE